MKLREKTRIYAYLDTLEYLKKGGRISSTAATIGAHIGPEAFGLIYVHR